MESQNNFTSPPLCATGCGFYASMETKIFCTNCYNAYLMSTLADKFSKSLEISEPSDFSVSMLADKFSSSLEISAPMEYSTVAMETLPYVNTRDLAMSSDFSGLNTETTQRCQSCNKRVRLFGFRCRCGQLFCVDHRYPETHCCFFDYKTFERRLLAAKNPLITADKLDWC